MSDWFDSLKGIGVNLATSAILVALVWFRRSLWRYVTVFWRTARALVTNSRYVLLWSDDEDGVATRLCTSLEQESVRTLVYRTLETPSELFDYPLHPRVTAVVVLVDCDVTPLAERAETREELSRALERFVVRGGAIVGTHDLIYRRAKAPILQRIFGCQLNHFARTVQPVGYRLRSEMAGHPLAKGLPAEFDLPDGEVCWGEWSDDVQVVYESATENPRPLVVTREVHAGRVVWLNSADRCEKPALTLAQCEMEFVRLMANAIGWCANETHDASPEAAVHASRGPLAVAHRGLSGAERENSKSAIQASLRRGVEAVEIDVRRAADGALVISHDPVYCGILIESATSADLARAQPRILTLTDVVRLVEGRCLLDVEIKEAGYEVEVVEELTSRLALDSFVITSFHDEVILRVKKVNSAIRCGLLLGLEDPKYGMRVRFSEVFPLLRLRACRADFVAPYWDLIRYGFLFRLKHAGYPIYVWTVNDKTALRNLLGRDGVSAVITDDPLLAKRIRNEVRAGES